MAAPIAYETVCDQLSAILVGTSSSKRGPRPLETVGGIDVESREVVAVVIDIASWQQGLGRLVTCERDYRDRRKILYLYGADTEKMLETGVISEACKSHYIEVMHHETDYAALKEEYDRRKEARERQDLIEATQHMFIDRELTFEEERELDLSMYEIKRYRDAALSQLRCITAALRSLPPADLYLSVSMLEIHRDVLKLLDRFDAVCAPYIAAMHQAREFISDSLVLQPPSVKRQADLAMYELDAVLREWCKQHECESYTRVRSNVKHILAGLEVHVVKTREGYVLRGVRLSHAFAPDQSQRCDGHLRASSAGDGIISSA